MKRSIILFIVYILISGGCDLFSPSDDGGNGGEPESALDTAFGSDGYTITGFTGGQSQVQALLVDSSDRIYAIGWQYAGGGTRLAMARYTMDGILDTGFGTNGQVTDDFNGDGVEPTGAVFDQDGKILVSGFAGTDGGNPWLARYNTDGSIDTTFATSGYYTLEMSSILGNTGYSTERAFSLIARSVDDAVYVTGTTNQENASTEFATFVIQISSAGALNTSWGTSGIAVNLLGDTGSSDVAFDIAIAVEGSAPANIPIVVGGASNGTDYDFVISKYDSTGAFDSTFGTGGIVTTDIGANDIAYEVHIFDDGDILVAGLSGSDGSPTDYDIAMARYDSTGSLDTTFGSNGIMTFNEYNSGLDFYDQRKPFAMEVDGSGRIYIAGPAASGSLSLRRFNADGSIDTTFAADGESAITSGPMGTLKALAFQSDGKVIAGGETGANSDRDFFVARYLAD